MIFFLKISTAALMMFFLSFNPVLAAMSVYPMEVSVDTKGTSQIKLISKSDEVQFVKITLKKIMNPGTSSEKEVIADESNADEVAVVPAKIALAAGTERVVRIVSLLPPKKETTWRAYFESVDEREFNDDSVLNSSVKKSATVGVNIIWGALIHVLPITNVPALSYKIRTGEILNSGNVRMPIKEIGVCKVNGQCVWSKVIKTIYPDMINSISGVTFHPGRDYRARYMDETQNRIREVKINANNS
ncbi:TPA: fimbrial protein [Enterobacter cloacae]